MAKKSIPVVSIDVEMIGGLVSASVLADGKPVDGEVQWWPNTPYRSASEGKACIRYKNPVEYALTSIRHSPPRTFEVTARVLANGKYFYSETKVINISEVSK